MTKRHPAIEAVLQHFEFGHLPEPLMQLSRHYHDLAHLTVAMIRTDDPQLTLGLQSLLTARDCAVRAYRIDLQARAGGPGTQPAMAQPGSSRWRPIDNEGNVAADPAPENPDEPDEGETGPAEIRG